MEVSPGFFPISRSYLAAPTSDRAMAVFWAILASPGPSCPPAAAQAWRQEPNAQLALGSPGGNSCVAEAGARGQTRGDATETRAEVG